MDQASYDRACARGLRLDELEPRRPALLAETRRIARMLERLARRGSVEAESARRAGALADADLAAVEGEIASLAGAREERRAALAAFGGEEARREPAEPETAARAASGPDAEALAELDAEIAEIEFLRARRREEEWTPRYAIGALNAAEGELRRAAYPPSATWAVDIEHSPHERIERAAALLVRARATLRRLRLPTRGLAVDRERWSELVARRDEVHPHATWGQLRRDDLLARIEALRRDVESRAAAGSDAYDAEIDRGLAVERDRWKILASSSKTAAFEEYTRHVRFILHRARERVRRAEELEGRLRELESEGDSLARRLARLEQRAAKEARDVLEVEREGFTSLVRSVLGLQAERVARERAEALRAALARDRVRTARGAVSRELEALRRELATFSDARDELARLSAEREQAILAADGTRADELRAIGAELATADARRVERGERVASLRQGLGHLRAADQELALALAWGCAEVAGAPFTISGKYEHFDRASVAMLRARGVLLRVARALDVSIPTSGLVADVPDWIRMLDRFGSRADVQAQVRMNDARSAVRATKERVEEVVATLEKDAAGDERREEELHDRRDALLDGSA